MKETNKKTANQNHEASLAPDALPGLILINAEGEIRYANRSLAEMFGFSNTKLQGKLLSVFIKSPDLKQIKETLTPLFHAAKETKPVSLECAGVSKNGAPLALFLNAQPLSMITQGITPQYAKTESSSKASPKKSERLLPLFFTDITPLKKEVNNLRFSEERYAMAQEFAGIGYWDWTIATGDLYWSSQIAPMFGYEPGETETSYENFVNAIHKDDRDKVLEAINASLESEVEYRIEHRVVRPDKTIRWLLERGGVMRDEEGKPVRMLGVVQDITSRKMLEQELVQAKEKAEAGALAKSLFLANMSHEIRTPMNSIIGFIDLVLENAHLDKQNKSRLKTASKSAHNLLTMINDILDLNKLEAGKMQIHRETFYLPALLEEVMRSFQIPAGEKSLVLKLDIDPELYICVITDLGRLRQILINLAGNAVKFTARGEVVAGVRRDTGNLRFFIEDSGIGMSSEELAKVFKPFTQADNSASRRYGGTGLGTTIARQLVELLGGEIRAKSEPGRGSKFEFAIPFELPDCNHDCRNHCLQNAYEEQFPLPCFQRPLHILLAEDVPENAALLKTRIEQAGSSVDVAASPGETLKQVFEQDYDLVLFSAQMANPERIEVPREIRESEKNQGKKPLPIIAMTTHVVPHGQDSYYDQGVNEIISKPVDFAVLCHTIEQVVFIRPATYSFDMPLAAKIRWPQIPEGVNLMQGIETWSDEELYAKALIHFQEKYADIFSDLEVFAKRRKGTPIYTFAHTLKGLAGNLALTEISAIAHRLLHLTRGVDTIDEREHDDIRALLDILEEEFRIVLRFINRIVIPGKLGKAHRIKPGELIKMGEKLIQLFSRGEMDDELFQRFLDNLPENMNLYSVHKLERAVEKFELNKAEENIREIIAEIESG